MGINGIGILDISYVTGALSRCKSMEYHLHQLPPDDFDNWVVYERQMVLMGAELDLLRVNGGSNDMDYVGYQRLVSWAALAFIWGFNFSEILSLSLPI